MKRTIPAVLLVLALLCGCCACGNKEGAKSGGVKELKVGALFSDSAGATGISYHHLLGLQKAAKSLDLPDPVCKYSVTDVSFDESEPVTVAAKPTESTPADEPESYTTKDGEVIVRAVPLGEKTEESAVSAAADLIEQGCNVIVATDPIYDDLTAFLAKEFKKVTFLQYRGTHTDLKNLQSFSDNLYEAFYLAGAVAGCDKDVKQIGFTARKGDSDEIDCINAFALGVAKNNPDAMVNVRMTHVDFDLYQERIIPLELIEKDKCTLLAQSVFTALPLSVAAGAGSEKARDPLPCIGFGYDMQADGGERYLCSVVFEFSAYYTEALTAISDGSFRSDAYTGGVKQGVVRVTALQHASDDAKNELQTLILAFKKDTLHPLEGFTPEKNGYAANITVR